MGYKLENILERTLRPEDNGSETISVASTAAEVLTVPDGSFRALLIGTADIRILFGDTPTTTEGFLITAGTIFELQSAAELNALEMIATSTTSTVTVLYFK